MISFIIAIGVLLLLWCEGAVLSRLLLKGRVNALMHASLGLPLAALLSALIIFGLTLANLSLKPIAILVPHGVLLLVFLALTRARKDSSSLQVPAGIRLPRLLKILCGLILACAITYSIVHAFVLPTFHYDSATNWNMRAKASLYQQQMIIEEQYSFIRKPHYPILFHSWQITAHQGQDEWSEPIANGSHWLLSFTSFFALFLFLRLLRGTGVALLCVTIIVGIPLMTLHLGQSYADATLVQFALLSLVSMMLYQRDRTLVWLILSALFCAACVWTKAEGLFFCLIPWLVLLGVMWWRYAERGRLVLAGVVGVGISAIWPIYALTQGLSLTPHSGADTALTWNPSALFAIFNALFVQGSFGIHWYVLVVAVVLILITGKRTFPLLWGSLAFLEYMIVYLFTANVEYLLLGQAFDRQMLLPAALLTLGCVLVFTTPRYFPGSPQCVEPA